MVNANTELRLRKIKVNEKFSSLSLFEYFLSGSVQKYMVLASYSL